MPLTRFYSRWNSQPTVASLPAPEFKWDVLVNQAFPAVNAVTGRSLTPRGSRFEGRGGRGQNWLGVNSLEQIPAPMPTTATGYTILWVGPINAANQSASPVIRTTSDGFRFVPYSLTNGSYIGHVHTNVAQANEPTPIARGFDFAPWTVIVTYDGATCIIEYRSPEGEYASASTTMGMNPGTGTLDLSNTGGSFGAYLVGYARRPMSERLRARYLRAPWNVFVQNKYLGWSSATDSVNLTGIAATISRGTLSPTTTILLSGQAVTVSRGTLTPSQDLGVTLTGLAATFLPNGSLRPGLEIALSGLSSTINRGTIVPSQANTVALTGLSSAFSQGTLGPALSISISGLAVTVNRGTLVPVAGNTVVLAGQAMTASSGSIKANLAVSLLGQSITTSRGTITPVTSGNVSVNLNGLASIVYRGDVGVSPTLAPETIQFSWADNKVVFTFQKYTTSFRFD